MSSRKVSVSRLEKKVVGTGAKVETFVDLEARKTRVEKSVEHGRPVIRIILTKDDAALL